MKIKQVFFMLIFILTNISANPLAEGEMWIRVSDYLDNLRGGVTITVYDINWQIVDMGITASTTVEQYGNAFIWMDGEPVSTSDSAYAMGPLEYEETYYFVIDNKYAKIHVGEHSQTPDEHLYFKNNTFTLNPTHNTFTLVSQADWNVKTVVVKNSFNAGNVKIDNTLHTNIGTNGLTKIFGEPTFPHTLEAIDNQSYDNYLRKFQSWSKNGSYYASNKTASITAVSATYTANFLNQFNLTFKNSFVGVGNGGTIKVNGITESSPTIEHHVLQFNSITVETVYQVINGIEYLFKEWNDGVTSSSRTITPTDNKNFTASFTGRPYNGYRNLHFNDSDPVGTPIKVMWNQHPNTNVTKYEIWRHKKNTSAVKIATVNRNNNLSSYIYTDYDYSVTHNTSTDNLIWYDVRAYYSVEGTYRRNAVQT
ncbi:hypothetical protein BMS3Abin04_02369 [bacterium BMS3Abin04]|nr:hypothetical protein BMS3Abin04_02369 [bacterium BMS3Abin04]